MLSFDKRFFWQCALRLCSLSSIYPQSPHGALHSTWYDFVTISTCAFKSYMPSLHMNSQRMGLHFVKTTLHTVIGYRDMLFCHRILGKLYANALICASFASILSAFVFWVNKIRKCTLRLCSLSSMHSQPLHITVNRTCFLCIWTRSKKGFSSQKPHFSQSKAVVIRSFHGIME